MALFSASKLERSGNKVFFGEHGSYIYNHATATRTPLRKHNGAYMIGLWVQQSDPADQLTGKIVPVMEEQTRTTMDNANDDEELGFPRLPYEWE